MRTALVFLPLAVVLPACGVAAGDAFHEHVSESGVADDSGTTDLDTSGWPGPISTLTTTPAESESDASTAGDTDGSTSEALPPDDPPGPPRIVAEPVITPNPIQTPGVVTLTVTTEDADAVRLTYDVIDPGEDDIVDLVPGEAPGTFVAELPAFTSLHNGWKYVVLTPSRGSKTGASVHAKYEVDLQGEAGTAGFWEAGDLIGPGQVAAMGMLPEGDLVELGTRKKDCYLRRRGPDGSWAPSDVVMLLPGIECEAVGMEITDDGVIFALVRRQTQSGVLWWLAELPAWGAEPKSRGLGAIGEEVHALAERDGTVAVCGTAPTQYDDQIDVLINVFRPGEPGNRSVVDYVLADNKHKFAETARDCVFVLEEDALLLVGDTFGRHGVDETKRSRRFTLTVPLSGGNKPEWVLPEEGSQQSFASAVDINDQGELAVVGYLCDDDPCLPHSRLWVNGYAIPLGYPPASELSASDVKWHPAGYVVVASPGEGADLWAFTARAFWPHGGDPGTPAWKFIRKDPPQIHLSRVVFVGPDGALWIAGWGANGYPAVANVYS